MPGAGQGQGPPCSLPSSQRRQGPFAPCKPTAPAWCAGVREVEGKGVQGASRSQGVEGQELQSGSSMGRATAARREQGPAAPVSLPERTRDTCGHMAGQGGGLTSAQPRRASGLPQRCCRGTRAAARTFPCTICISYTHPSVPQLLRRLPPLQGQQGLGQAILGLWWSPAPARGCAQANPRVERLTAPRAQPAQGNQHRPRAGPQRPAAVPLSTAPLAGSDHWHIKFSAGDRVRFRGCSRGGGWAGAARSLREISTCPLGWLATFASCSRCHGQQGGHRAVPEAWKCQGL